MIPEFRAWHITSKRMHQVCALDVDRGEITVRIDEQRMHGPEEVFVLMQSTTQRDRMQRMVYAGDILSHPLDNHPGVVVWHDGGFCVEIQALPDAPEEDRSIFRGHMAVDNRVNQCTMLGNIYESPGILDARQAQQKIEGVKNGLPTVSTIWRQQ